MTALVRLYPRAWRDRYEAEFLGVLEARPPSSRDRLDILRGALDARLHPEVPGSPEERGSWLQPIRLLGVLAIVAGLAWLMWAALILGDVRWLESGASDYADLMAVTAAVAYLALAVVHLALAAVSAGRSAKGVFATLAGSIAVVALVLSGFGTWWTPIFALPASAALAAGLAGWIVPRRLAVFWAVAALVALGVFLGGLGPVFGSVGVVLGAVPFGLFWVTLGATLAMRGLPARATLSHGSG